MGGCGVECVGEGVAQGSREGGTVGVMSERGVHGEF